VYDPTLPGLHGIEGDDPPGLTGPVGHALRHTAELFVATFLVSLNIDVGRDLVLDSSADDEVDQELERVERLSSAPDEQPCVVSLDFEREPALG